VEKGRAATPRGGKAVKARMSSRASSRFGVSSPYPALQRTSSALLPADVDMHMSYYVHEQPVLGHRRMGCTDTSLVR
jgi:hypothetical protein